MKSALISTLVTETENSDLCSQHSVSEILSPTLTMDQQRILPTETPRRKKLNSSFLNISGQNYYKKIILLPEKWGRSLYPSVQYSVGEKTGKKGKEKKIKILPCIILKGIFFKNCTAFCLSKSYQENTK